ncbi:MAG: hypothetical protein HKN87_21150 [Saprospiraceae bacterium]|nr:hypothetical protein [Saprospiraceae bacterium]
MKKVLLTVFILSSLTAIMAQQLTCDDVPEIIQLEERSWNENQELQDSKINTDDFSSYQGDVLLYQGFKGRKKAMQRAHDNFDDFKLEIPDYSCTGQKLVSFWKMTATYRKYKIPIKAFGMTKAIRSEPRKYFNILVTTIFNVMSGMATKARCSCLVATWVPTRLLDQLPSSPRRKYSIRGLLIERKSVGSNYYVVPI